MFSFDFLEKINIVPKVAANVMTKKVIMDKGEEGGTRFR
jgi:hypothetical protein